MSDTAMVPLREALVDLVKGDSGMLDLLTGKRIFAAKAPPNTSPNYVIVGPILLDVPAGYFHQPGRRHKRRLTAYARTSLLAEVIFARLVTLLDGARLTVSGHTMQTASLTVSVGPVEDEDRELWGLHGDWTVETLAA